MLQWFLTYLTHTKYVLPKVGDSTLVLPTQFDVYSRVQKSIENSSVRSKMVLGEVVSRRVTPMTMPRSCPSNSRLLKTFFKSHNFFIMEK